MNAWRTQLVVSVLALLLGGVYVATLPPGPVWGDGLEFTAVVHVMGIPHPTGYPLYVMLARAWSWLPLGSLAWELHLLSATLGVAAALLLFGAVREAMPEETEWEDQPAPHHWRRSLIPAGAALAWGLTPTVWQAANVTEVYTLFAVFLHAQIWLMLRQLRDPHRWGDPLIALLFGLSLTHQRLIVVLVPALAVFFVVRLLRVRRTKEGRGVPVWLALNLIAFVVGLLPLLYLPLRAAAQPPINWGDPSTPERLLWVLRGGEFVQTRFLSSGGIPWEGMEIWTNTMMRIRLALTLLLGEFVPMMGRSVTFARITATVLLALMALGWWRSRRALRWGVPITVALNLALVGVYNIADFQPYLIPTVSAAWFWLAFGLMWLAEGVEWLFLRRRFTFTALVLGLLPLWLGVRFFAVCDRSQAEEADAWARRVLESTEPGALLLTRGDGDTYALWCAQLVDGVRPDVTVFGSNFMWSDWYRSHFSEEEQRNLFFENIGFPPDTDYYLTALVGGVIAPNLAAGRPVYTCFNPYESHGNVLVSLWPRIFEGRYYEIIFMGHTLDVEGPGRGVAPPANPLIPPEYIDSMRRLGEPAPQLYRLIDNPSLTEFAMHRFEEEVAPGHAAYLERQRARLREHLYRTPTAEILERQAR